VCMSTKMYRGFESPSLRHFIFFLRETVICPPQKQYLMMKMILDYAEAGRAAVKRGASAAEVGALPVTGRLSRLGSVPAAEFPALFGEVERRMEEEFDTLGGERP